MRGLGRMLIVALAASFSAQAANYPCSGKKGGVSHCEGRLFICNDGTASRSKKNCAAEATPTSKGQKKAPKKK